MVDHSHAPLLQLSKHEGSALRYEGLEQVVDTLALRTSRNITLDDAYGNVMASNTSLPTTDRARIDAVMMKVVPESAKAWRAEAGAETSNRPFVQPGNRDLGYLARLCIPLSFRGIRVGYFWILARDEYDDLEALRTELLREQDLLNRLTERVAGALLGNSDAERRRAKAMKRALLGKSPLPAHGDGRPFVVAVARVPTLSEDASSQRLLALYAAKDAVREAAPDAVIHAEADHLIFVIENRVSVGALAPKLRVAVEHRGGTSVSVGTENTTLMGVSDEHRSGYALPKAYDEAVVALQAAHIDPGATDGSFAACGIYKFLPALRTDWPSSLLDRLLNAQDGFELTSLLERVYDSDASMQTVADELHMHRTSLYNRLQRISRIIEADPLLAPIKQELHLALKMRRWQERPRFNLHEKLLARPSARSV